MYPIATIIFLIIKYAHSICNKTCSTEYMNQFKHSSDIGSCLSHDVFGYEHVPHVKNGDFVFCFRKINHKMEATSTSKPFKDPRFLCRKDIMEWYRGKRNVAFDDTDCEYWHLVPKEKQTHRVENLKYSTRFTIRNLMPDYDENFCRNPDKHELGPWCYTKKTFERKPCFPPCNIPSLSFMCLDKRVFGKLGKEIEATDILDIPQLIEYIPNVHLMFESRILLHEESILNTHRHIHKTCVTSGRIADSYGPWIAVLDSESKNFIKSVGHSKMAMLCVGEREKKPELIFMPWKKQVAFDAINEDELTAADCSFWRSCFTSCQDDSLECWPLGESSYYGAMDSSEDMRECLSWTRASVQILEAAHLKDKTYKNAIMALLKFYYWMLFDKDSQFTSTRLFINSDNICRLMKLTKNYRERFKLFFTVNKKTAQSKPKSFWYYQLQKMFDSGPGCFVQQSYGLSFEPCYKTCEANYIPTMDFSKNYCKRNDEYVICDINENENYILRGRFNKSSNWSP